MTSTEPSASLETKQIQTNPTETIPAFSAVQVGKFSKTVSEIVWTIFMS